MTDTGVQTNGTADPGRPKPLIVVPACLWIFAALSMPYCVALWAVACLVFSSESTQIPVARTPLEFVAGIPPQTVGVFILSLGNLVFTLVGWPIIGVRAWRRYRKTKGYRTFFASSVIPYAQTLLSYTGIAIDELFHMKWNSEPGVIVELAFALAIGAVVVFVVGRLLLYEEPDKSKEHDA